MKSRWIYIKVEAEFYLEIFGERLIKCFDCATFVLDIKLAVGWNKLNLELAGIWPEPTLSNRTANYKSLIHTTLIVAFISAPQCVNLFLLNGNLELITENLCLANIPATGAALKILFTWYHREGMLEEIRIYQNRQLTPSDFEKMFDKLFLETSNIIRILKKR